MGLTLLVNLSHIIDAWLVKITFGSLKDTWRSSMKVGDLVKGTGRIHLSYYGVIGLIVEVIGVMDNDPRFRVWWPDGRKHWHDPSRLEYVNESR